MMPLDEEKKKQEKKECECQNKQPYSYCEMFLCLVLTSNHPNLMWSIRKCNLSHLTEFHIWIAWVIWNIKSNTFLLKLSVSENELPLFDVSISSNVQSNQFLELKNLENYASHLLSHIKETVASNISGEHMWKMKYVEHNHAHVSKYRRTEPQWYILCSYAWRIICKSWEWTQRMRLQ